jgi:DNA-binding response OmpR family regulator
LIFLGAGASFRHETRKAALGSLSRRRNRRQLRFDDYSLDVARRELWRGSEPIMVAPQVFDRLVYLVQRPERAVTKVPTQKFRRAGASVCGLRCGIPQCRHW